MKWVACTAPDGQLLWAARTREEPDRISDTVIDTDGDSIWTGYLLKSGALRLGKFESKTLRKQASLEMAFEPTTVSSPYVFLMSGDHPESDLQISAVQPVGDSLRVALFSRDLRIIFNKLYGIATPLLDKASQTVPEPYLAPLPDRSGYYLCAWHRPGGDTKAAPAVAIVRLDNSGTLKWANTYSLGNSTQQSGPRVTEDGAILISAMRSDARSHKTLLAKVSPDGAVNWATTIDGVNGGPPDLHMHADPYRFTSPHLLVGGPSQYAKDGFYSVLLALNYETGKIEKQLKFAAPGAVMFAQKRGNSFYAAFSNQTISLHPVYRAALLKFDFDFNLLAARRIREPASRFPGFRLLPGGSGLVWYSYSSKPTMFLETINENLESPDSCQWLDKDTFTFSKSTVQQQPLEVITAPFTSITVSDVNVKTTEADVTLFPFDLKEAPCNPGDSKVAPDKSGR